MKRFIYIIILFFLSLQGRSSELDSLKKELINENIDSSRIDLLLDLSWRYSKLNQDSGIYFAQHSLRLSKHIKDKKRMAKSLRFLAINYRKKGSYEKSLKALFDALKIEKQRGDHALSGSTLLGIGNNYYEQNQLDMAEKYWMEAIEYYQKGGMEGQASAVLSNLGALKSEQRQWQDAINYYRQALAIDEELGHQENIAGTMINMGDMYFQMDSSESQLKSAEAWFKQALDKYIELNNRNGEAAALISMAQLEAKRSQFKIAEAHAKRALHIYKETSNRIRENQCYEILYKFYKKEGDYKNAFEYQNCYLLLKDSILNEVSTRQINELSVRYETAEKEKMLAKQQLEITKQSDEILLKNLIGIGLIIGVVLLIVLSIFIFLRFRDKHRANILISEQKEIVEKQNANIVSSINYARNIQHAILPSAHQIAQHFNDSLVLYRPKDVVSGDFFWFNKGKDHTIIVVADCTGHGVPGAFMSMLGVSLLNEIVVENNIIETNIILDELRKKVIKSLKQEEEDSQSDDGMDISIIRLDSNRNIQFSGTSTPLLISDGTTVKQINPGFQSISYIPVSQPKFKSFHVTLQDNEKLYLVTDGYMDQIGGENFEKFGLSRLKEMLLVHHSEPMEKQKQFLNTTINEWISTSDFKQIDDICIVGIQL